MKPHTVSDTARHTGKGPSSPRITTHRPASHTVTNQETRSHTRPPTVTPGGGSHPHTATCRWVSHAHPHCGHPQISITSVHKHLQTGRTRTVTPARRREGHTHTHTHSHPRRDHTVSCIVTPRQGSHPHIQSPQGGGHTHVTPDGCHARTQSLQSPQTGVTPHSHRRTGMTPAHTVSQTEIPGWLPRRGRKRVPAGPAPSQLLSAPH